MELVEEWKVTRARSLKKKIVVDTILDRKCEEADVAWARDFFIRIRERWKRVDLFKEVHILK